MNLPSKKISIAGSQEESSFFPVRCEEIGQDDTAFQRFVMKNLDPLFREIELREYSLKKYIDAIVPYQHTTAIYEIHAKEKEGGQMMVSLVWVHCCPHEKQYEGWKVCKYVDFKPYKPDETKRHGHEGPPFYLFKTKNVIPVCAC